jgi:NAD-dependent SIR2 family protein deacetylase
MSTPPDPTTLAAARDAIAAADALLIHAGAGIGVDSGLPDFRGSEGFWQAYPPFRALGLDFAAMANPRWFTRDPAFAWGFYGHRLALYRETTPHAGFAALLAESRACPDGAFIFTSNVDGQFAKAGFETERIVECHGSIHHIQCATPCCGRITAFDGPAPAIDPTTMRAVGPLPTCPACHAVARPNILMFGDSQWLASRSNAQEQRFESWLRGRRGRRVVILEFGAGLGIPTVRHTSEQLQRSLGATLVRINPREPEGPPGTLSLPLGALAACRALLPHRFPSDPA